MDNKKVLEDFLTKFSMLGKKPLINQYKKDEFNVIEIDHGLSKSCVCGFGLKTLYWIHQNILISEKDVMNTFFGAMAKTMIHELKESFLYENKLVFDPHFRPHSLRPIVEHKDETRIV